MGTATISQQLFSFNFYFFCFVYLFIFYFNIKILFLYLYLHKNYILYFAIILALFFAVYLLTPFDNLLRHANIHEPPPHPLPPYEGLRRSPMNPPPGERHLRKGPFIDINSL